VTTKKGSSNLLQMPRPSRPLSRRRRALRVATSLIICACAMLPATAWGAGDTLQISVPTPTPEQALPMTIQFSGAAESVDKEGHGPELYAVVRPAGGIGCQSNYANDHSAAGGVTTDIFDPSDYNVPRQGPGPYQESATYSPPNTGTFLVCAWLEGETTVAGPASATFSARGPQVYELAVGLPAPALPGVAFQINYTTHTDQQLTMYSVIRPSGGLACAANHELDSQQNQNETNLVFGSSSYNGGEKVFGGPATIAATTTEPPGPYYDARQI
jgi:hypothetical protein